MDQQIIELKTAKLLREKGFVDESMHAYSEYQTNKFDFHLAIDLTGDLYFTKESIENSEANGKKAYLAPYQFDVITWFRKKHNIDVTVMIYGAESYIAHIHTKGRMNTKFKIIQDPTAENVKENCIYEQCLERAIYQALKLI